MVTRRPMVTRRAAVLGSPIAHSLSPALYRAGFAAAGLADWAFDRIDCTAEALPGVVADAGPEWAGFAVTMPGKRAAAQVAAARSERVEVLGVANTLVRRGPDWFAHNTDVDGVTGALAGHPVDADGPALLLGGGGTARAVVAALAELGWAGPLLLAGRTPASTVIAGSLADRLGLHSRPIGMTEAAIADVAATATLVVSTVPAGAADHLAPLLAEVPILFDVVYDPWPTALAAARGADRVTVTGLDMLLRQAIAQFEMIVGQPAPVEAMRAALPPATR